MVNDYTDTTVADLLNSVRVEMAQNKAENNKSTNPILEYILGNSESLTLTDVISLNGNSQSLLDNTSFTDSVLRTSQSTGTFLIDTAQIDFSDVG